MTRLKFIECGGSVVWLLLLFKLDKDFKFDANHCAICTFSCCKLARPNSKNLELMKIVMVRNHSLTANFCLR